MGSNINLNSSLDLNLNINKSDNIKIDENNYNNEILDFEQDKDPKVIFKNINEKNKEIKDLFNINMFDQSEDNGEDDLECYLEENCFFMILEKISNGELDQEQLINMPDEKILLMVEDDNKEKFSDFRQFLMKLDENNDADDLLMSIDKTIGN